MKAFGLIGKKLSHSFSKRYFKEKFTKEGIINSYYELYELQRIDELKGLLDQNDNLRGLNVTIPYKKEVIPFLDKLDDTALKIGAVNTIKVIEENGSRSLVGYNTDYLGFRESLEIWLDGERPRALVLGTGGAASAVCAVLNDLDIEFKKVSRQGGDCTSYEDLKKDAGLFGESKLIINCTPLGMHPNIESMPDLDYDRLDSSYFLYDLVYNPELTAFMQRGLKQGARVKNGLEMLRLQAEHSWTIWNS